LITGLSFFLAGIFIAQEIQNGKAPNEIKNQSRPELKDGFFLFSGGTQELIQPFL
jgi:hypothetical protein